VHPVPDPRSGGCHGGVCRRGLAKELLVHAGASLLFGGLLWAASASVGSCTTGTSSASSTDVLELDEGVVVRAAWGMNATNGRAAAGRDLHRWRLPREPGPRRLGAVLRWGETVKELWGGEPQTTNNRMELRAVIEALGALKRPVRVRLHTDSTYVHQGISKWIHGWKRNGWRTASKEPVKNADLWRELDEERGRHEVEWLW